MCVVFLYLYPSELVLMLLVESRPVALQVIVGTSIRIVTRGSRTLQRARGRGRVS